MTQDTAGQGHRSWVWPVLIGIAAVGVVVLLAVLAFGTALWATSSPTYFKGYHDLVRRYGTLETSAHKDLACADCHSDSRTAIGYRLGLIGDFYAGLFSKSRMPLFTKFEPPTRDACMKCHSLDWSIYAERTAKVPHPAHLKVQTETRDCVGCHRWTAHEEDYMQRHKSMPFSGVCAAYGCHAGYKSKASCGTCHHSLSATPVVWRQSHPDTVRVIGPNACLERCHTGDQCRLCHTTGKVPVFTGLQTRTGLEYIQTQHAKANWVQKHGAIALADKGKCLECHVSQRECEDCHSQRPAFHGSTKTWVGKHKNYATNPARCYECHAASWCKKCHQLFKAKN